MMSFWACPAQLSGAVGWVGGWDFLRSAIILDMTVAILPLKLRHVSCHSCDALDVDQL